MSATIAGASRSGRVLLGVGRAEAERCAAERRRRNVRGCDVVHDVLPLRRRRRRRRDASAKVTRRALAAREARDAPRPANEPRGASKRLASARINDKNGRELKDTAVMPPVSGVFGVQHFQVT